MEPPSYGYGVLLLLMRIAFLADIHGNLPALEAVLDDLKMQSPDAVFLVGDQVNRCPWSNEVMDLIENRKWQAIHGNHELVLRMLAEPHEPNRFDERQRFPDLWWTLGRLGSRRLQTIGNLPSDLLVEFDNCEPIRVVHGIPGDPFRGLFMDTDEADMASALKDVREPVVVCGHTHQPLLRTTTDWKVLNGGSVGIPYNGDPRAQYLILSTSGDSWVPSYRRVEYPVSAVREAFHQHGLEKVYGPLASIHLRTVETAQPWTSDFGHWLNMQSLEMQSDLAAAVELYEKSHGPGNWSFLKG